MCTTRFILSPARSTVLCIALSDLQHSGRQRQYGDTTKDTAFQLARPCAETRAGAPFGCGRSSSDVSLAALVREARPEGSDAFEAVEAVEAVHLLSSHLLGYLGTVSPTAAMKRETSHCCSALIANSSIRPPPSGHPHQGIIEACVTPFSVTRIAVRILLSV